ncbi:MAG: AraC family transcriptional regulator [Paenibacillus sp.]|nr:AraC family transcriptional regulator [Paenibacillus sp.]
MNNVFFSRFHPRVIDVVLRERSFWTLDKRNGILTFESQSSYRRNFMFAFEGVGMLEADGVSYPLSAGSVFYFPLGSRIRLTSPPDQRLQFFSVHYDYALVDWEGDSVKCSEPVERSLPLPICTQVPDVKNVANHVRHLYDLWHGKNADYEWKARLAFLNLLNDVIDLHSQSYAGDRIHRSIKQCMEYIKTHYAETLEREKLAEVASLSTSYFSIIFKKVAGYTPTQYITKVRLDMAKQLLQNSNKTVSEVAREVGFQDPLYFGRVFSNYTGLPPKEFKKA